MLHSVNIRLIVSYMLVSLRPSTFVMGSYVNLGHFGPHGSKGHFNQKIDNSTIPNNASVCVISNDTISSSSLEKFISFTLQESAKQFDGRLRIINEFTSLYLSLKVNFSATRLWHRFTPSRLLPYIVFMCIKTQQILPLNVHSHFNPLSC